MKRFDFHGHRQQGQPWEEQKPDIRPFRWGQLERPLAERLYPRATRTAYGEEGREIIDTTPPPISRRRITFWMILAVIVTAIFIASALFWHWYGTLPR